MSERCRGQCALMRAARPCERVMMHVRSVKKEFVTSLALNHYALGAPLYGSPLSLVNAGP